VLESLRLSPDDISTIERREVMLLRGQTLPLVRLQNLFQLSRGETPPLERHFVVVVGLAQHRLGLLVDDLCGQQDIVIKSLGPSLDGVAGIAGATELGGQKTVLVLDVGSIVEETLSVQVDAA
jgi:two-component system chemotaxis sensor kinase CheA